MSDTDTGSMTTPRLLLSSLQPVNIRPEPIGSCALKAGFHLILHLGQQKFGLCCVLAAAAVPVGLGHS